MTQPFALFLLSLLVYWIARSQKAVSRLKEIHKTVTESSANGLTNLSVFMAVAIIYFILLLAIVSIIGIEYKVENMNYKLIRNFPEKIR